MPSRQVFQCDVCDRIVNRKNIRRHMRRIHGVQAVLPPYPRDCRAPPTPWLSVLRYSMPGAYLATMFWARQRAAAEGATP